MLARLVVTEGALESDGAIERRPAGVEPRAAEAPAAEHAEHRNED